MDKKTLIMKFGGTSVGTPEAMSQVVKITKETCVDWPRVVVVASALAGVTNRLLESATLAAGGDTLSLDEIVYEIRNSHHMIADHLITDLALREQVKGEVDRLVNDFVDLCNAIEVLGEATPRAMDAVASLGERMCVRLLAGSMEAAGLPAQFIDATQIVITDDHFQSAFPDLEKTCQKTRLVLEPIFLQGRVPVITGFIGANHSGVTTTLGRGGGDYSAALIGAALPAEEVWIWTDVDGVMTADPRLVPLARTIPELTYKEVAELAYFGAKVLHPKTIRPVIDANIGLRVCNTFNPQHPGTRLVMERAKNARGTIQAVTAIGGLQLITVEGRGMLGVPGVAARTFGAVAATGTSVPLITQASSEQSICFAVPREATQKVLSGLEKAFAQEITNEDIDRVWATDEMVIITVVGDGMRNTPGIAGRVFSALGSENINVIAIAQGSSEVAISLVLDAHETKRAVQVLHNLIDRPK